jgi:hypothetical protein
MTREKIMEPGYSRAERRCIYRGDKLSEKVQIFCGMQFQLETVEVSKGQQVFHREMLV